MRFNIRHLVAALVLVVAIPSLRGQDSWDTSFKLCGGQMTSAKDARLGTGFSWALAMEGAFPILPKGSLVMELGYRTLGTNTTTISTTLKEDDWSKGFYGSVLYRHTDFHGFWEGLYLHGGLRYNTLESFRETTSKGTGPAGTDVRTEVRGRSTHNIGPLAGVGFRFNDKISLEANVSQVKGRNLDQVEKSGTMLELALGMHL